MGRSDRQASPNAGLVVGGRGDPDDELLIDGQEEVFSRSEVELGRIEHDTRAGSGRAPERERPYEPSGRPRPTSADEAVPPVQDVSTRSP